MNDQFLQLSAILGIAAVVIALVCAISIIARAALMIRREAQRRREEADAFAKSLSEITTGGYTLPRRSFEVAAGSPDFEPTPEDIKAVDDYFANAGRDAVREKPKASAPEPAKPNPMNLLPERFRTLHRRDLYVLVNLFQPLFNRNKTHYLAFDCDDYRLSEDALLSLTTLAERGLVEVWYPDPPLKTIPNRLCVDFNVTDEEMLVLNNWNETYGANDLPLVSLFHCNGSDVMFVSPFPGRVLKRYKRVQKNG